MSLTPERFAELDRHFSVLVVAPEGERAERLGALAARDAELAREVAALLRADATAAPLFDGELPWTLAGASLAPVVPGERLGAYRIREEIGRGGMSVVYRAARDDQRFEHEVAIKVCRREPGLGSFAGHLAAECRILARLEHPAIARLLDAGSTATGLPYFVLELVEGERIDAFCSARGLGVSERLRLFRAVLDAVAFAHQRLVVHRDLKPSNILVTAAGRPKLLDFGIAKLLTAAEESGEVTATGLRPLTPHYASPEQLAGESVTTATDIYSLGMVLFKTLTGALPGTAEDRPSRLLSAPRALACDLDAVVGKALRPEPERRYRSVAELADDLDRLLAGQAVEARAGSRSYRLGKLLRRHRVTVAAAALLTALTAAFIASGLRQAAEVRRERDQSRQVLSFFLELLAEPPEGGSPSAPRTVDQLLTLGAERLSSEFQGSTRVKATLLDRLGSLLTDQGSLRQARPLLEQALALRRAESGEEHSEVAESLLHLADLEQAEGRWQQAEERARQATALYRQLLPAADPAVTEALHALATLRRDRGGFAEAEALLREELSLLAAADEPRPEAVAAANQALGETLRRQGRWADAGPLLRASVELRRATSRLAPLRLAANLSDLANLEVDLGHAAAAVELFREALGHSARRFSGDHPLHLVLRNNLARALTAAGHAGEAVEIHRASQRALKAAGLERHPSYGAALHNLADALGAIGQGEEAEPLYRRALAVRRAALGPVHPQVAQSENALAGLLARLGRPAEAEELYRQAIATFAAAVPAGHPHHAWPRIGLATLLAASGQREEVEALLAEAVLILEAAAPADHFKLLEARKLRQES